ncbi:hypothetical protein QYF61_025841, partial [Mycteria americana]
MSPISSLALVTNRSSNAYFLIGLSTTWLKKLSSMHSRSLLDCLQLTMLLFQQMLGWLKSPSRMRACKCMPPVAGFTPIGAEVLQGEVSDVLSPYPFVQHSQIFLPQRLQ